MGEIDGLAQPMGKLDGRAQPMGKLDGLASKKPGAQAQATQLLRAVSAAEHGGQRGVWGLGGRRPPRKFLNPYSTVGSK